MMIMKDKFCGIWQEAVVRELSNFPGSTEENYDKF